MKKLVASVHDKEEYVIYIRIWKQALSHGLVLKQIHRVIKFNQKTWLKSYIDMNTVIRNNAKKDFEKDLISNVWWIMQFLKKMKKVREHGDIKLVTIEEKRNYLV